MALGALQALAAELKSDIVKFYNFNQHGKLPRKYAKGSTGCNVCLPPDCRLLLTAMAPYVRWMGATGGDRRRGG
jgi:hypothetical protein